MMKLYRKLVINHSFVRVLCRGKDGSGTIALMARGVTLMIQKLLAGTVSDVQHTALTEILEIARFFSMLLELEAPDAKLLESVCNMSAADKQTNLSARGLIRNAIAKCIFWRGKETRAREVASAVISLKPELDKFGTELPGMTLAEVAKACMRFPVWIDGLPRGPLAEASFK